jgi:hypothetical protein
MLLTSNTALEATKLNQQVWTPHRYYREGIITAISAGVFFILVGMIFVTRPGLYGSLQNFFSAGAWTNRTIGNTTITVPVPANPAAHTEVYNAVLEFCLAWGFFQILILVFRFVTTSPRQRKARTISGVVFWFGTAYLINTYLNATATQDAWLTFWAAIVVLIGVTLIVRAIALALIRK